MKFSRLKESSHYDSRSVYLPRTNCMAMLHTQQTINCAGRLVSLDVPRVMGIINVTSDSFVASSRKTTLSDIVSTAGKMLAEGADFLDIGGMSSRPGAVVTTPSEEITRVVPAITAILEAFPEALISVDTIHHEVAKAAAQAGAVMINDISAGKIDPKMYETVAELGLPYILMHMRGRPENMQALTEYDDVLATLLDFLTAELATLRALGVKDIIADPGFGFGKTVEQNFIMLEHFHVFKILGVPLMAGLSRKSMIYKTLQCSSAEALNGTSALHIVALQQGARLLRVHDVREAKEVVLLWQQLEQAKQVQACRQ